MEKASLEITINNIPAHMDFHSRLLVIVSKKIRDLDIRMYSDWEGRKHSTPDKISEMLDEYIETMRRHCKTRDHHIAKNRGYLETFIAYQNDQGSFEEDTGKRWEALAHDIAGI